MGKKSKKNGGKKASASVPKANGGAAAGARAVRDESQLPQDPMTDIMKSLAGMGIGAKTEGAPSGNRAEGLTGGEDRDTLFRLLRVLDSALQKKGDDMRAREGLPPKYCHQEDLFLGTIIDDELFAPPPPSLDCPVCFLTLPDRDACTYQPCCGKVRNLLVKS